jgi:hypothetical protein
VIICDVSAIDKLIDFYGEYLPVDFEETKWELSDFRDHCEDNKIKMSIDECTVNQYGIFKDNILLVKVLISDSYNKDDLSKL